MHTTESRDGSIAEPIECRGQSIAARVTRGGPMHYHLYTLMLFLFEYRAARALIAEQFPPGIAASIASFRVDSDVISLAAAPLQAESDIAADGRVRVFLRRSTAPSITNSSKSGTTPRPSNLTGVEIYSLQSSRESTPRGSSFNQTDFYSMLGSAAAAGTDNKISRNHNHHNVGVTAGFGSGPGLGSSGSGNMIGNSGSGKELHMYVWSASSVSPVSEANLKNAVNRAVIEPSKAMPMPDFNSFTGFPGNGSPMKREQIETENGVSLKSSTIKPPSSGSPYMTKKAEKDRGGLHAEENQSMPAASVMSRLILIMVWRKLIRNPNTYSSLIGLVWSFVSFRWNIEMPEIIKGSIAILSDAGLGMAMFSLGLFMALQPKIISCGKSVAAFSMFVRFLSGPAVMAAASIAVGIRGVLLHIAIVQAALPQGIVPFVFAKEYNCHPDILSTAVIFGMLIALPITILYYILLGV